MIECPKCHAPAMSRIRVTRFGKEPGRIYEYDSYVHYNKVDKRRPHAPRRSYCYVRLEAS